MPKIPKSNKGMNWYVRGRKTRVCGCSYTSGLLVEILLEQFGTFAEALKHIAYDVEAKEVCRKMIKAGCK